MYTTPKKMILLVGPWTPREVFFISCNFLQKLSLANFNFSKLKIMPSGGNFRNLFEIFLVTKKNTQIFLLGSLRISGSIPSSLSLSLYQFKPLIYHTIFRLFESDPSPSPYTTTQYAFLKLWFSYLFWLPDYH